MATPTFILPSAPTYTEGFVNGLNVYPNPTNFVANQVPFTRATTATRTNAAGLIELVPYNLLQYSERFSMSPWSLINGATIAANTVIAPDGTLTADTLTFNGTAFGQIQQASTRTTGDVLTFSLWIKSNTFTSIDLYIGSSPSSVAITSSWQRVSITKTLGANDATPKIVSSAAGSVDIWGAQLVEGTAALPYQLTETRLNRPRVDFSLGGCPNLLLEPQRTNLALRSEEFDNAAWTKGSSSISANTTTAPSGVLTADTFTANGTSNLHNINQSVSVTSGVAYTMSIYAKKDTNNFIQFTASASIFSTNTFANFDLNNGVVGSVGSAATATITNVGNGWYRCTMTATATATATNLIIVSSVTSETSPRNEINTLSTSVFLWGAQFEAGAYPTSYIPTTSASVTRNTDTFTLSNVFTNNLISSAGGTWFVDLRNNRALIKDNIARLGLGDTSVLNSNGLCITSLATTATRFQLYKIVSGTYLLLHTTTSDNVKIAYKWNGTTADIFVNGVKVVNGTSFTTTIMEFFGTSGIDTPKNINSMALYNTPISDAECIAITTL